jgi:CHAD domain-containing protein
LKITPTKADRWIAAALRCTRDNFFRPEELPAERIEDILGQRFGLRILDAVAGETTAWDTFDWRVWFAGRTLIQVGGKWLLAGDNGGVIASKGAAKTGLFASNFTGEQVRLWLDPVLGPRAVMAQIALRWNSRTLELLDPLRKTICRVELTEWIHGEHTMRLATIQPLRGYEPEAEAARALLAGLPLQPLAHPPLWEILTRAGRPPREFSVRSDISLSPEMPVRTAACLMAGDLLRLARSCEPGILQDVDIEFLHDYRVCLRKMRSVIALLKGAFPEPTAAHLKTRLAGLARRTNRLRDSDVHLASRSEYEEMLPPELRDGLGILFDDLAEERGREWKTLTEFLASDDYSQTIAEVEAIFRDAISEPGSPAGARPIGPLIFEAILHRYRKIVKKARKFDDDTPDEVLHEIRIQCKKLRYLLEFATGLVPAGTCDPLEDALRKLQNGLGLLNDLAVQQRHLLDNYEHDPRAEGHVEIAMAVGGLASALYDRRRRKRAKIRSRLRDFCRKEVRSLFNDTFTMTQHTESPA